MADLTAGERSSAAWDTEAATFDEAADHGLRDPVVRAAWRDVLRAHLPHEACDVVDLGCGTGSLAVLAAEAGHRVHGVDFSPAMLRLAAEKASAAGVRVRLDVGDAAEPVLPERSFDVVMCRHVLWALPDPAGALRRWVRLLRPGGTLLLVEGRWSTGAGLSAEDCRALLAPWGGAVEVQLLSDPDLWGGAVSDERYLATTTPAVTGWAP